MTKRAQLADGTVLEFPDETPDEVMDRAVRRHMTSPEALRAAKSGTGGSKGRAKTRTEQLVESGALPAAWQIPVQAVEQGLRSARQGVSFGFADELAGAGAGVKAFLSGGDARSAYIAERDRERALSNQFGEDYPAANLSGQIGGGLLTGAGPAKAVQQAPTLLRQIARAIPAGGFFGALAGTGTSEADTAGGVAMDAGKGGLVGAAIAPVFPVVGASAGAVSKLIPRKPVRATVNVQASPQAATAAPGGAPAGATPATASVQVDTRTRAADIVADTLRKSGKTPQQIEAALVEFEALGGKPEILADFLGDQGARRLYSTRVLGGEGSSQAVRQLVDRAEGTAARVSEDVQAATAQRGQSLSQLDDRIQNRRRTGNTLYQQAFSHGEITSPDTLVLLQNPRVAGIVKAASERRALAADLRGENYTPLFRETDQGPVLARAPTVEDLHLLKTSLDDDIRQAFDAKQGEVGKALRNFKDRIVRNLEDEVPAYRQARDTYRGDAEIEGAITTGRADILRKPVDELRRDFAALSGAEQDAFRIGAIDQVLAQKVDRGVDAADFARKLWGNADMRNRLALLVRGPDELTKLVKQLEREQTMAATQRGVLGGSPTAMRDVDVGDTAAQAITDVATKGVTGAAMNQVQRLIQRAGGITEPVADDIARLLTAEGPQNIRAVLEVLKGRERARVVEALNRQRAGRAAANTAAQQTNGNRP